MNSRVNAFKCLVRPLCVLYSVWCVSALAFMAMIGYNMPAEGVGAACVYALLGIAGTVTSEYYAERGYKHIVALRRGTAGS